MKLNIFVALALSTSVLTLAAPVPAGGGGLTSAFVGVRKALSKIGPGKSRKVEESYYAEGFVHDPKHPGWGSVPSESHSNHKGSAGSTPEHSPPASPPRQPSTAPAYSDPAHRGAQRHAPAAASGRMYPDTAPFTSERRAPAAEQGRMYPVPPQYEGSHHSPAAAYGGHVAGIEHMRPTGAPTQSEPYIGMQYQGPAQHFPAFSQSQAQHAPVASAPNYAGYPNIYPGPHGSYPGHHGSYPGPHGNYAGYPNNYPGYQDNWSSFTYRPGHSYPGQSYAEMGNNRHFMDGAPGNIVSPPREHYPWSQ